MKISLYLLLILTLISCKNEPRTESYKTIEGIKLELKYAEGFSVTEYGTYKVIEILNPWPKSEKTYKYGISNKNSIVDWKFDFFDATIDNTINKIVVTSTTHIPALELLGVEQTLVGFPGTDYISSEKTRTRIDNGYIRELGNNEGINTEVLLELRPDVVIAFGVDGNNKSMEIIQKAGIPVIYNGDWVEKSPLAKAEWITFFGALYNKEKEAEAIFNQIESDYIEAKKTATEATSKPTVLSGAMYKDVWYLPNGTSPEAQFLKDANVNYLWSETKEIGSLALSFEVVFEKGKNAQLWLSPSYYTSYEALEKSSSHYTKFDAFQNKNIFTFSYTTGKTGGVLYYELGTSRPDLVLKDIIKICHPELLTDYEPTFFKPLE